MSNRSPEKRLVLVTGGTRGLGLAITRRLIAEGYHVVAASRRGSPELTALQGAHAPGTVDYEPVDLARHDRLHGFVREVTQKYGPLYGLVNNAAVGYNGVLATMHESQISELMAINLTGTIILTKYALRSMLLQRSGRVINVASIIAFTGFNGLSVYAATKAGLMGFTRSLAREVGKAGITVNAIAPGYMETDMTASIAAEDLERIRRRSPLHRLPHPEDVAGAVAYLVGPDGASVTGTTVTVDAGSTA